MNNDVPTPIPPPVINPSPPSPPGGVRAVDLRQISAIEALSVEQLRQAVADGGRFVVFQYCISVVVLSFKRSSPIFFVRSGESAVVKGLPYCLISLVAGWWG